jgi:tetratricopeptide (TPR) repeat protein
MVLRLVKTLILFSMIFAATNVYAKKKPYLNKAMGAFKRKQYSKAIKFLNYSIRKEFRNRAPGKIYLMLGLSYWGKRNYAKARSNFQKAINKQYYRMDRKLRRQYRAGGIEEDEAPKALLNLYYKIGSSLYVQGKKSNSRTLLKEAQFYFTACEDLEFKEDQSARNLAAIEKHFEKIKKLKYNWESYISVGNVSWQEKLNLKKNDGTNNPILSTVRGACLGGGLRYANGFYGYKADGCFFVASANVIKTADAPIGVYNQNGVIVTGFLANGGIFVRPDSGGSSFGVSGVLFSRDGQYTIPTTYSMAGKSAMSLGMSLDSTFQLPWDWEIDMQLANLSNVNVFSLRFNYRLF